MALNSLTTNLKFLMPNPTPKRTRPATESRMNGIASCKKVNDLMHIIIDDV